MKYEKWAAARLLLRALPFQLRYELLEDRPAPRRVPSFRAARAVGQAEARHGDLAGPASLPAYPAAASFARPSHHCSKPWQSRTCGGAQRALCIRQMPTIAILQGAPA